MLDGGDRRRYWHAPAPALTPDVRPKTTPHACGDNAMRESSITSRATFRQITRPASFTERTLCATLGALKRKYAECRVRAQFASLVRSALAVVGLSSRRSEGNAQAAILLDPAGLIDATLETVRDHLRRRDPSGERVMHIDLEVGELHPVRIIPADLSAMLERILIRICEEMPAGGVVMVTASASEGADVIAIEAHRLRPVIARPLDRSFSSLQFDADELVRALALAAPLERLSAKLRVDCQLGAPGVIVISIAAEALATKSRAAEAITDAAADVAPAPIRASQPLDANASATRASGAEPRRVLIIDDDPGVLASLREGLEHRGYRVASASSGYDGLRYLREDGFDFVICDVAMPGMSGWELAERAEAIAPGTPIVLVTGWANEIGRRDPRRKLVVDVLAKPVGLDEITELIARSAKQGHSTR